MSCGEAEGEGECCCYNKAVFVSKATANEIEPLN
jgi:hypothetical protein